MARAILVVTVALVGCVSPPTADARSAAPVSCRGREAPAPTRSVLAPPCGEGRVEVRRVGGAGSSRIALIAEQASLDALAIQLAELLELDVIVTAELSGRRLTLAIEDGEPVAVTETVARAAGAVLERIDGALVFVTAERAREDARLGADGGPTIEVRRLDVAGVDPGEAAELYCAVLASPRGAATVIGERLVVSDEPAVLDRLEAMLAELPN